MSIQEFFFTVVLRVVVVVVGVCVCVYSVFQNDLTGELYQYNYNGLNSLCLTSYCYNLPM